MAECRNHENDIQYYALDGTPLSGYLAQPEYSRIPFSLEDCTVRFSYMIPLVQLKPSRQVIIYRDFFMGSGDVWYLRTR